LEAPAARLAVAVRIVFFGTPDFAVPTLDALAEAHDVALVVTRPDRPAGRGQRMSSPPVAARALERGLDVAQPRALRDGPFPDRLRRLGAELGVVIAYGRILPGDLLAAPRHGCVNVHASLLPRWRGAAPIQAAILAGDAETGVCTQHMEETLDTGDVLARIATPIVPDETAGSLHDRLAVLAARCAIDTLADWARLVPAPQDESLATWAPKITRHDGALDWNRAAVELDRRIRAMTPWPGADAPTRSGPLRVRTAHPTAGSASPGTVLSVDPLVVAAQPGALHLVEVQVPGRRPLPGAEYARGARLTVGARI